MSKYKLMSDISNLGLVIKDTVKNIVIADQQVSAGEASKNANASSLKYYL